MTDSNQPVRAIELFAGIGGFRLGMQGAGIETIWANDINELACQVYRSNFGEDAIVCADITQIPLSEIPDHDLLTAGFPCQPFSPAGKKLGVRDRTRGTLFETIVEILAEKQPQYFLLENVKRMLTMENGYHFRTILAALSELDYLIEWRIINPLSFGIPQNRDRLFIFGAKNKKLLTVSEVLEHFSVFLTLPDIETIQPNSIPLDRLLSPIQDKTRKNHPWGIAYRQKMYDFPVKPIANINPSKILKDILQDPLEVNPQFDFTEDTLKRISQSKVVNRYCNGVEILYNQEGGSRLGYTIFGINGIASTLTASTSRHYERYKVGDRFRRLTDVEYARLMGFPDDWCRIARIYDRYSLFGNSIVPACVEWVVRRIGQKNIDLTQIEWQQLSLFS
jgi:DNA (cytosine-5)-methyltransferase 1